MHRLGPNCTMQYVSKGAIASASSSEPMGLLRVCQSKPRRGMPRPPSFITTFGHAATAAMPRRRLHRIQHRRHALPKVQVGVTNDGCSGPTRAIQPAGAGRSQTLDEFDLAHGTHLLRSVSAVHGAGLNKHGGAHVVTALDVRA